MNIDKLYKPLEEQGFDHQYDPDEVLELEEKYKELLAVMVEYTQEFSSTAKRDYGFHYEHSPRYKDFRYLKSIVERHTNKTWEEIK